MITIEQIRAGRGLIGWTQGQLAKATGISLAALNNIERKAVLPRTSTLTLLQKTLENAGVEFTEGAGVRPRGEKFLLRQHEGKKFVDRHTEDILSALSDGGFIYVISCDERNVKKHSSDNDRAYQNHMRRHKIDERIITPEGDDFFLSSPEVYRTLPQAAIGQLHWMVYGENIAFYLWEKPYRAVTITNQTLAQTYKKQFLFLWKLAKPVRRG